MTKNYILKPFEFAQEKTLFLFGTLILVVASIAAALTDIRYDGVLDLHIVRQVKWYQPLLDNSINTICLALCLYLLAMLFNTKTRVIDLVNTVLIARIPLYISSLFIIGTTNKETEEILTGSITDPNKLMELPILNWILLGVGAIAAITALVFMGILLYQGFKVATNVKSTKHKLLIIPAVILAEILSKLLVYTY